MRDEILDVCCPTYFNLMKVMYPLLADVYELNRAVDSNEAGDNIGSHAYPLNQTILLIRKKYKSEDYLYKLSQKLEQRVKDKKNPAFFLRVI